jgi:pyruvate,water dikinase|tara:strand:- start:440 stop:1738 length:1299 start_codon:yes stop_codon:yes gene_type:complete
METSARGILMKTICKAQNFGLNTTTCGPLEVINNYSDIQNFKKNNIALFNKNFVLSDSLIIISNLLEKGAKGFISFNSTKSDHGCIAAKEMGMNFYSISSKSNKILSYEGKNVTLKNEKIFEGTEKKFIKNKDKNLKKIYTKHKVKINLGFPDLIISNKKVIDFCDGVGFSRIEFLLSQILQNIHPKKYLEMHGLKKFSLKIADSLRPAVKAFYKKNKEYWIRTDDLSVEQLINMEFGKVYETKERNISSGLRGIRRSIRDKEFIIPQFKAIKILLNEGFDNIAIFPPMTNSIKEYKRWLKIAEDCGIKKIKKGLMVETPRAALMIEEFLKHINFVVFGTNDLTSFLLSVDRNNPRIQNIFNETDEVVMKVIKETIIKCKNKFVETYIGGQIADNEKFIKELTAVGLTGVSVNPDLQTIYKIRKFYSNLEKK